MKMFYLLWRTTLSTKHTISRAELNATHKTSLPFFQQPLERYGAFQRKNPPPTPNMKKKKKINLDSNKKRASTPFFLFRFWDPCQGVKGTHPSPPRGKSNVLEIEPENCAARAPQLSLYRADLIHTNPRAGGPAGERKYPSNHSEPGTQNPPP